MEEAWSTPEVALSSSPNRSFGELADDEIRPILESYDEVILDRVHQLLCRVGDEDEGWREALDGKANLVLGFSAAMITASAAWLSSHVSGWLALALALGASILAVAIGLGFWALRAQPWPAWADGALLPTLVGSRDDRAEAKRYWAHALFLRHKEAEVVLRRKWRSLRRAQIALATGVSVVSLVGLVVLCRQFSPSRTADQTVASLTFSAAAGESPSQAVAEYLSPSSFSSAAMP